MSDRADRAGGLRAAVQALRAELKWAKGKALSAMTASDLDFRVGETEYDAASINYERMAKFFDALDAALRVPEGGPPWQPIETAPTNTSVLVFIPNAEHYGEGIYRALQVDMGTGRRWMTTGCHVGRNCGPDWQPTHWLPLPEAPGASQAGEG